MAAHDNSTTTRTFPNTRPFDGGPSQIHTYFLLARLKLRGGTSHSPYTNIQALHECHINKVCRQAWTLSAAASKFFRLLFRIQMRTRAYIQVSVHVQLIPMSMRTQPLSWSCKSTRSSSPTYMDGYWAYAYSSPWMLFAYNYYSVRVCAPHFPPGLSAPPPSLYWRGMSTALGGASR